ncbi:uncharacterized protein METZ01_LOCUS238302 [marine metagenome]|uniref:Uncharacterized protein n=1 Tax=marine metagenome TaxID=408172 RepID=A0A382HDR1_9ZZZZ
MNRIRLDNYPPISSVLLPVIDIDM